MPQKYKIECDTPILHAQKMCECEEGLEVSLGDRRQNVAQKIARARAQLVAVKAEKYKRSLSAFTQAAFHQTEPGTKLEWGWYLDAYCNTIQALLEDWLVVNGFGNARLIQRADARWAAHGRQRISEQLFVQNAVLNAGPGTLKSRIAMVMAPAWVWLYYPPFGMCAISTNEENVKRDSIAHQNLVTSDWYKQTFGITWSLASTGVEKWETSAGGKRMSRVMGARFTGIHEDWLSVDDPDGATQVLSEAERVGVQRKWSGEVFNRIRHPEKSIRTIVQQRVHPDDLSGFVIRQSKWSIDDRMGWARFVLPMESGRGPKEMRDYVTPWGWQDPRKEEGEPLHPRFTAAYLSSERRNLGSYRYASQYNQNPEVVEGGFLKRSWLRFCRVQGDDDRPRPRPDGCSTEDALFLPVHRLFHGVACDEIIISVDATFGSLDTNASAVSILVFAREKNKLFLIDEINSPLGYPETRAACRGLVEKYGNCNAPVRMIIEKKANGATLIRELTDFMASGELKGRDGKPCIVVVMPVEVNEKKEERFQSVLPFAEAGLLYIREGFGWTEDVVTEICGFPNARRDDRADALSQTVSYVVAGEAIWDAQVMTKW